MAEVSGTFVRQYVGKWVRITLLDGPAFDAELLSFDGRSLWLVAEEEDRFVLLSDVAVLRLATKRPISIPGRPILGRQRRPAIEAEGRSGCW